ncbi:hypothetical protein JXC34_00485 [Candidatus Woesearchaeota archaeon]|nr:hypothetical protein [Candidatus Woesearchaeota archaeon]
MKMVSGLAISDFQFNRHQWAINCERALQNGVKEQQQAIRQTCAAIIQKFQPKVKTPLWYACHEVLNRIPEGGFLDRGSREMESLKRSFQVLINMGNNF